MTPKVEPPKDDNKSCRYCGLDYPEHNTLLAHGVGTLGDGKGYYKQPPTPPQSDEVMSKFWAIFNKYFPQPITGNLPAFEKEVDTLIKLQQEALLLRVEKEVIGEDEEMGADGLRKSDGADMNHLRAEQRANIDKLRLEL
jgi:hypothetical protein